MLNKCEYDILCHLRKHPFKNQRVLAQETGYSLGTINKQLKNLSDVGYINEEFVITSLAIEEMEKTKPHRAIILAAGLGMRMVPVNTECPKGLIEVKGELLIERIIRQLHMVNIHEIYIVVGFMKEQYEYLIDEFNVKLIVNKNYVQKNNLFSLGLILEKLENAYVIPCDLWCKNNPFQQYEMYSWYMVSDNKTYTSNVRITRKQGLVRCADDQKGNRMVGIAYLLKKEADYVRDRIQSMIQMDQFADKFWEEALWKGNTFVVYAKIILDDDVTEINTYEQLRQLDSNSSSLESDIISLVAEILGEDVSGIKNVEVLKKGMTNRSFTFICKDEKYIMRIPGEGTEQLINREQEYAVYDKIKNLKICDDIIYMNPKNGYKLTRFIENAKVCDIGNAQDLKKCMDYLRAFHEKKIEVDHSFDLWEHIEFYESLWEGKGSVYRDYEKTKKNVYLLKSYLDKLPKSWGLTHIDAVPDNFLLQEGGEIRLIDWEYAGMQDQHVDIAMFCIYALYGRRQIDEVINFYFKNQCEENIRLKIYCYIAICGLLWSNWCEYKRNLGVEFGEYSLCQYRYAKDYFRIVQQEIEKRGEWIDA